MSKILSQEEIDALLSSTPTSDTVSSPSPARSGGVITYNFRRPDRVSKEQIRSLHFLHDRFARNVAGSLAAFLRTVAELSIVSVEQFSYSEFLMSLPDPTVYYAVALPPLDGLAALELNPTVAYTIVDRMLGGSGVGAPPSRAMTEIEQNVVDSVVRLIMDALTETWRAVVDIQFKIHNRETRPQMLQVASPNEVIILLVFDLKVGDIRGTLNLCIPASVIEATGSAFIQGWQRTHREPTAQERQWLHTNLGRVPMVLTSNVETRLPTREVVSLGPGDVLSLGIPIQSPVSLCVEKTLKFQGRLTAANGHAAIRIERRAGGAVLNEGAL